jgi:3-deoxy-alpha-D-manno-octulosonate 8-oxidase
MRLTKSVGEYLLGFGSVRLADRVLNGGIPNTGRRVYLIDHFFSDGCLLADLPLNASDTVLYVNTSDEPTTEQVDSIAGDLRVATPTRTVVGIGGGSTLDVAKAVSNLLTNGGSAADYQGWDLVKVPGVFKVGVPTISGTGAEASRTCVMKNRAKNLKLGMNSDYTVFDRLILDP